jgi:hypothetical protein
MQRIPIVNVRYEEKRDITLKRQRRDLSKTTSNAPSEPEATLNAQHRIRRHIHVIRGRIDAPPARRRVTIPPRKEIRQRFQSKPRRSEAIGRTNRAGFYSTAARCRAPRHDARNYSTRAATQSAHVWRIAAPARHRGIRCTLAQPTRPRLRAPV